MNDAKMTIFAGSSAAGISPGYHISIYYTSSRGMLATVMSNSKIPTQHIDGDGGGQGTAV